MAFGTQDDTDDVMNEINMTPLVDVMLVLLIIFIITVPVMKHAVNIDLPRATNQPQDTKPETIRLSVDAQGSYYWNENKVAEQDLARLLKAEAARNPAARAAHPRRQGRALRESGRRPWLPRSRRACARSASSPSRRLASNCLEQIKATSSCE
jgi:biopolymer transport protein ExbD